MRSMPDTRSLLARLSRANVPALVCGGGRDDATRLAHVRRLARELPDGRLELFDTNATPEEERPDDFAKRVGAFLFESQNTRS